MGMQHTARTPELFILMLADLVFPLRISLAK